MFPVARVLFPKHIVYADWLISTRSLGAFLVRVMRLSSPIRKKTMRYPFEDSIKVRLTDRVHLMHAVEKLLQHVVSEELIPARLARVFYVDIDASNVVLNTVSSHRSMATQDGGSGLQAAA